MNLQTGAVTGFFDRRDRESDADPRVLEVRQGGGVLDVLWSNASGSVLIGVIPDSGGGRVGVISGNEFTPLSICPGGSASPYLNTW